MNLSYKQVIADLNKQEELTDKKWDLDKIRLALQDSNIKKNYPSIQIVGTNGKGTTSFFIQQILLVHNKKVGLYTSPHLVDVRERIKINNKDISEQDFAVCYNNLKIIFEKHDLSYFEKLVLMATIYFAEQGVDYVVFETGLGGRLDAVTALDHDILGITSIGYDHQEYLGNTIEEIIHEKSFPMQFVDSVFALNQLKDLNNILVQEALTYKKEINWVGYENAQINILGTTFDYEQENWQIPMFGVHYADDVSLALRISKHVLGTNFDTKITQEKIKNSLWLGRLQLIKTKENKLMLLSCAHNEDSIAKDLIAIKEFLLQNKIDRNNVNCLITASRDRPLLTFVNMVKKDFQKITVTQTASFPLNTKNMEDVKEQNMHFIENNDKALKMLLQENNRLVIVIGSIYLCGEVLEFLAE